MISSLVWMWVWEYGQLLSAKKTSENGAERNGASTELPCHWSNVVMSLVEELRAIVLPLPAS